MIRRAQIPGYRRSGAGAVDDTDALQTDVMRFMSILGLCLMAVFALVQSLPLHDSEHDTLFREDSQLQQRMDEQQQRVRALNAELQQLLARVEQASAQQADKDRALSQAQLHLADVISRTRQAREQESKINRELDGLQKRLDSDRLALAQLDQTIDSKGESLRSLQLRLSQESQALDEIRQAARDIKRQRTDKPERKETRSAPAQREPTSPEDTVAAPAPMGTSEEQLAKATSTTEQDSTSQRSGFTLRFVSDQALRQLIGSNDVQLFAMIDERAWRVTHPGRPGGRPVVIETKRPDWFHEMAPSTVPRDYVRQLEVVAEPTTMTALVWGVQLPQVTRRDVASLTGGSQPDKRGGDLVIAADGRVRLVEK